MDLAHRFRSGRPAPWQRLLCALAMLALGLLWLPPAVLAGASTGPAAASLQADCHDAGAAPASPCADGHCIGHCLALPMPAQRAVAPAGPMRHRAALAHAVPAPRSPPETPPPRD